MFFILFIVFLMVIIRIVYPGLAKIIDLIILAISFCVLAKVIKWAIKGLQNLGVKTTIKFLLWGIGYLLFLGVLYRLPKILYRLFCLL